MSKIRLLSDHLANQIAAGEVVERPASVVKELVENSLDAGASRISVQVEGSGARLIRVVDNGEGMDGDDVLLSLERHATSKLREESRLDAIATLGFRGEALPSIGSVSRLILQSRPADRETGSRAEIRYGKLHGVHEAGCAQGTMVEVRNLFGNVPARKKFLKTNRTELYHIEEVVRNQALAHVKTAFILQVDGRTVLDFPPREALRERFLDVFRRSEYWLAVAAEENDMGLHGFLLQPEPAASRGSRLRTLVNGRPVQDRMLRHAVIEGLAGFLMKGQAPGGALLLDVPPDRIDVNVHPAKQEIRFRNSQEVHRFVARAVKGSIQKYQERVRSDVFAVPTADKEETPPARKVAPHPAAEKKPAPRLFPPPGTMRSPREDAPGTVQTAESEPLLAPARPPDAGEVRDERESEGDLAGLQLVGQLFDLYLLCAKGEQLVVIDQHAAHERIIYEQLRRNYLDRAIPKQSLMFPVSLELTTSQAETVASRGELLAALGFTVEHFGGETWVVKSVPALAAHVDTAGLLYDTLDGLRSCPDQVSPGVIASGIESLLSSMACRAAVKAGHRLRPEEMLELLAGMRDTGCFSHCPHGRPVVKTFAKREIEQWFKRV